MLTTLLALVLAIPAAADSPTEDLCRWSSSNSGCIGFKKPPSSGPDASDKEPKEPVCDDDCRRRAAEREAHALATMKPIYPVESVDSTAFRESRTIRATVKGDDDDDRELSSLALVIGARMRNPWLAIGVFIGVVVLPRLHLEQYTQCVSWKWPENWTFYVPPPKIPPGFPNARVAPRRKTPFPGGLRKRWLDENEILEWDYQHGRVEKYSKRGKHLGEYDADTGEKTKEADPKKEVEPE